MPLFKFEEDDLFVNTIEAYPRYSFYVQSGSIYLNSKPNIVGVNDTSNHLGVPKGFISLYEYNIDRPANSYIYPFLIKDGSKSSFRNTTGSAYTKLTGNSIITSSYRMSASISRDFYNGSSRSRIKALKNVFNHYAYLSPHYQYSSSFGDKAVQTINLISIPSVFYGSSIKKGSVKLKFYMSGSLIGELQDKNYNGELIQVGPQGSTGSGSVAGVVLYNEGFVALTGSWALNADTISYDASDTSKWIYFNYGANDGKSPSLTSLSSSFLMQYSGTTHIQTMTMFAHAKYGELNHSNNPTYISGGILYGKATGSIKYYETTKQIKNVVYSQFADEEPDFKKVTYISKVAIYDKDKKLIGIAKVATPVRKTEEHQYTFKLKLDI
jgi:hypothetical protein